MRNSRAPTTVAPSRALKAEGPASGFQAGSASFLAALGLDEQTAVADPRLRDAFRNLLVAERYAGTSANRDEALLAAARQRAAINVFVDALVSYR